MKHGDQNSRIDVVIGVIRNLLNDVATLIESSPTLLVSRWGKKRLHREMDRDFSYILSRLDHEGLPFLTTTLPRLGKWYDSVMAEQSGDRKSVV